ncbi:MAG: hypothetical protein ACX939_04380, partial [Hyphococcus sp.]
MTEIETLLSRAETVAAQSGLSLSTVSRKLFNDGKAIARLRDGGQCTLKTLETARARLTALEAETPPARQSDSAPDKRPALSPQRMTHLDRLEA